METLYDAIARSFCYSTFLLLDFYSPWLLLAVSVTRHFLLLAITQRFFLLDVSTERHYLQFYSTFPLPVISITRRFSAPVTS